MARAEMRKLSPDADGDESLAGMMPGFWPSEREAVIGEDAHVKALEYKTRHASTQRVKMETVEDIV